MQSDSRDEFTIGVIGSGFAARTLVAAATASPRVGRVVVTGGSRVSELCSRYGARAGASVEDVLASADAVAVATPHATHASLVEQALASGVHVFCEKPFVTVAAEGEKLIADASRRGLTLSVNHFQRYRGPHRVVSDFLEREGVRLIGGQARLIEHAGTQPWKAEACSRGFMLGYGVHVIDLLHTWTKVPCVEVKARSMRVQGVERATSAVLRFADGQEFSVFTSDLLMEGADTQPGRAQLAFELLTQVGMLQVDSYGSTVLHAADHAQELGRLGTWDDFDSSVRLAAYQQAVDQFVVACTSSEEPELTAAAALHAVRVCEAIEVSAGQGGDPACV